MQQALKYFNTSFAVKSNNDGNLHFALDDILTLCVIMVPLYGCGCKCFSLNVREWYKFNHMVFKIEFMIRVSTQFEHTVTA